MADGARKVGVLLVNHGSHSPTWRKALLDLEETVEPALLADGRVAVVATAFMEYTEPSIATRLQELDAAGVTDVVMVPVFLTVSPHSFDDIPTIIGQKTDPKSLEMLKLEGIKRYTPRARVHMTALLDFEEILERNVLRRVRALSKAPAEEGLVLVAYGDKTYEKEWAKLLEDVGRYVADRTGVEAYTHAWCGHLVHYDSAKTTEGVERVLATKQRALVVPVLVAHDEMFQVGIIGKGIAAVEDSKARVAYRPDAILPDPGVTAWVEQSVRDALDGLGVAKREDG